MSWCTRAALFATVCLVACSSAGGDTVGAEADVVGSDAKQGKQTFPDHWIDGTACGTEPKVQSWSYDADTFIFRQSLCTSFEGPFIYLLFGRTTALVLDTGTGEADVRSPVAAVVADWL